MKFNGKNKVMNSAAELTKDRRFLFRVGEKIAQLGLVGEIRNRLIVFLAAITLMIKNQRRRTSVMIVGSSGSGKSALIETPLKLFPPEWVVRRASLTRHALAYNKESLDGKILYVTEYGGGKDSQYHLRILQSEGEVEREYTVGHKTDVTGRLGTPVVLTTTTAQKIGEDDKTRFLTLCIDESADQNVAVFKSELGIDEKSDESQLKMWQAAIQSLKDSYQPLEFPDWFDYVAEQVPRVHVRARRDWKRFLGLVEAIAICRHDPKRNGKITFEDYCIAYDLLEAALTATTHTINENELRVQRAVAKLHKQSGKAITISEVRDYLEWDQSMTYKHVKAAATHKLIEHEQGTLEKNVKRLLPVPGKTGTFLAAPRDVLDHVKELGKSVEYIDPLTGELKTINRSRAAAA